MDFFESQDVARRKTKLLVLYFILAVAGVMGSITAAALAGNYFFGNGGVRGAAYPWWDLDVFLIAAGGTLVVITLGTAFKTMQLSAGGSVVAKDLGGRRLDPHTRDFHERQLMNVVEEMAIASGTPVPEIFVLEDEKGVNAFAAGRSPSDAVIGVTRGCMRLLTRDELQGVVAHEFSHILNGDMRLNLRLIGLLHGVLVLAIIGRVVLQSMRHLRFSSRNAKGGGAFLLVILLSALVLLVVGSVGVFFGKLIKAAVSRQREFLADASAVQFTRHPDGIAGALKKIGGLVYGSRLESPRAEEASHMFFANGMGAALASMFATHPPLDVRISRVTPHWDGKFPRVKMPRISAGWKGEEGEAAEGRGGGEMPPVIPLPHGGAAMGLSAAAAIASMGRLNEKQVEEGRLIREELPESWVDAVHHPSGAQALVFAMLLAQDDDLRGQETAYLEEATDFVTLGETMRLHGQIGDLHSSRKLALIDMAIPALRRLPPDEYERFLGVMHHLMKSDAQINLFEFTLQKIVRRHLDLYFQRARPPRIEFRKLRRLRDEMAVLLSTLAHLGHSDDEAAAKAAFAEGAAELVAEVGAGGLVMVPAEACSLDGIDEALDRFDRATPLLKKQLLHACGKAVMADERIESDEAELLRAIADTIGCPIPPFISAPSS